MRPAGRTPVDGAAQAVERVGVKLSPRPLVALVAIVAALALLCLGAAVATASETASASNVNACKQKAFSRQSSRRAPTKTARARQIRRCVQTTKRRTKTIPDPPIAVVGAIPVSAPARSVAPTSVQATTTAPVPVAVTAATEPAATNPVAETTTSAPTGSSLTPAFPQHLVVGIDGGWGGWGGSEIQQRMGLGAAVTRHEWNIEEPVNAQDSLVYTAASQIHTRIHALLGANELGDPTHYREFVIGFIQRYGLGGSFWREHPELNESAYAITTFELGNEPYFGGMSATSYAQTVRPVLEEVERLGLPAEIVLDNRVEGSNTSWMETLYRTIPNLNSLFYAFAEHPYWYGHDPAQAGNGGPFARIATTRSTMNALGAAGKPIFITEYGESTGSCGSECVSEATQAQHLQEMIQGVVNHPEWGVGMLLLFQLNDYAPAGNREGNFGLLRINGTPKPAYAIVKEAVTVYRG